MFFMKSITFSLSLNNYFFIKIMPDYLLSWILLVLSFLMKCIITNQRIKIVRIYISGDNAPVR